MKTRTWITVTCLPAALGLALIAGCGKKESAEEQPAAAPAAGPAATPIDPATAAVVVGVVKLDGAAPKEAIKLDQSGCRYHPHVMGVVAGQTISIINSDPTTHNIHPTPKDNREWNESQPPKA